MSLRLLAHAPLDAFVLNLCPVFPFFPFFAHLLVHLALKERAELVHVRLRRRSVRGVVVGYLGGHAARAPLLVRSYRRGVFPVKLGQLGPILPLSPGSLRVEEVPDRLGRVHGLGDDVGDRAPREFLGRRRGFLLGASPLFGGDSLLLLDPRQLALPRRRRLLLGPRDRHVLRLEITEQWQVVDEPSRPSSRVRLEQVEEKSRANVSYQAAAFLAVEHALQDEPIDASAADAVELAADGDEAITGVGRRGRGRVVKRAVAKRRGQIGGGFLNLRRDSLGDGLQLRSLLRRLFLRERRDVSDLVGQLLGLADLEVPPAHNLGLLLAHDVVVVEERLVKGKLDAAVDVGQARKGEVDVDGGLALEARRDAIEELLEHVRHAGLVKAASLGEAQGVDARVRRGLLEEESSLLLGQDVELRVKDKDRRANRGAPVEKIGTSSHGKAAEAGKRYTLGRYDTEDGSGGLRIALKTDEDSCERGRGRGRERTRDGANARLARSSRDVKDTSEDRSSVRRVTHLVVPDGVEDEVHQPEPRCSALDVADAHALAVRPAAHVIGDARDGDDGFLCIFCHRREVGDFPVDRLSRLALWVGPGFARANNNVSQRL